MLYLFIFTAVVLLDLSLGYFIYKKKSQNIADRIFFALIIFALAWSSAHYISTQILSFSYTLFWIRLSVFFAIPLISLMFLFSHTFPSPKIILTKAYRYVLALVTLLMMSLSLTPYFFESLTLIDNQAVPSIGQAMPSFVLFCIVVNSATTFVLLKKLKGSKGFLKSQFKTITSGFFVMWFLVVATVLVPIVLFGINYFVPILPFYVLIFLASTTYAIARHKFLDVKLVLRRWLVYGVSVSSIAFLAVLARSIWNQFFGMSNAIFETVLIVIGASLFSFLKGYYYRFANHYLFSSLYDPHEVVSALSDKLRSTLQIKKIYEFISSTIDNAFHTKKIAILIYDTKKGVYWIRHATGFLLEKKTMIVDNTLHQFFINHDEPTSVEDLEKIITGEGRELVAYFKKIGAELINPLNIKDSPVGLILMGAKESNDTYNEEDIKVLNIIGTQAAIALENALLFEEAKKFTITLKKEITQATEQLRDQNEKLQKLDELKTEFVSVASHQLRTPLTATKWVLEYLNDALKNKATPEEKESLEELSVVNKKLIKLVNELLNISRIEDGRVRIDPKPMDFVKMVKTTMKEFMPLAKQQKLKVVEQYDELPLINLDEAIMSKAIANFLSNGIKYNKYGGVLEITIKKTGKNAVLIIRDEGIGIPEAEKKNLFQKFYRASNAISSHTEGTGLGLYIAKSAIELSGGTLALDSQEGRGSTFTITIPLTGSKKVEGEKSLT